MSDNQERMEIKTELNEKEESWVLLEDEGESSEQQSLASSVSYINIINLH